MGRGISTKGTLPLVSVPQVESYLGPQAAHLILNALGELLVEPVNGSKWVREERGRVNGSCEVPNHRFKLCTQRWTNKYRGHILELTIYHSNGMKWSLRHIDGPFAQGHDYEELLALDLSELAADVIQYSVDA